MGELVAKFRGGDFIACPESQGVLRRGAFRATDEIFQAPNLLLGALDFCLGFLNRFGVLPKERGAYFWQFPRPVFHDLPPTNQVAGWGS